MHTPQANNAHYSAPAALLCFKRSSATPEALLYAKYHPQVWKREANIKMYQAIRQATIALGIDPRGTTGSLASALACLIPEISICRKANTMERQMLHLIVVGRQSQTP